MPKDFDSLNIPITGDAREMLQTLIVHLLENNRDTAETKTIAQRLLPLLALLERPNEQELTLGQKLEQILARLLDRLDASEKAQQRAAALLQELQESHARMEVTTEQISVRQAWLNRMLFSDEAPAQH